MPEGISSVTPAAAAPAPGTSVPKNAQPVAGAPADPKAVPTGQKGVTTTSEDTFEVQVDGRPQRLTKKEIIDAYQLRQVSDKKRSEADKVLQEYNKLFEVYKKDPIKFMKATGVDFENLATQFLAKKAEDAMMDPKDKELREAKAKAAEYEKWMAEQKTLKEQQDKDAEVSVERSRIHSEIIQAIEEAKDLGLPVDEELVIQVAQKMMLQDKKQKPLNAKEALPKAYESSQKYLKGIASKMEGDQLVKWLGEDVVLKLRKFDLARLKAKRAPAPNQALVQSKKEPVASAPKYKTWSQFKAESLDTIK